MKTILLIISTLISASAFSQSCRAPDNVLDRDLPGEAVPLPTIDTSLREALGFNTYRGGIYLTNNTPYVMGTLFYFKDGKEVTRINLSHGTHASDKEHVDMWVKSQPIPRVLVIDLMYKFEKDFDLKTKKLSTIFRSAHLSFDGLSRDWTIENPEQFPQFVGMASWPARHPYLTDNSGLDITSIYGKYDDFYICGELFSSNRKFDMDEFSKFPINCTSDIKATIINNEEVVLLGIYATDDYVEYSRRSKNMGFFEQKKSNNIGIVE
jgi:hypothetical protein